MNELMIFESEQFGNAGAAMRQKLPAPWKCAGRSKKGGFDMNSSYYTTNPGMAQEVELFLSYLDEMERAAGEPDAEQCQAAVREKFRIDNDLKAEWAVRRVDEEARETARIVQICQDQMDFYRTRMDEAKARLERRTGHLNRLLEAYFDTVPHRATKTTETYALACGRLVRKKLPIAYERDDAAILAWARDIHTDYIKLEEKLDWARMKKELICDDATGECVIGWSGETVPGLRAVEKEPIFEVKLNG